MVLRRATSKGEKDWAKGVRSNLSLLVFIDHGHGAVSNILNYYSQEEGFVFHPNCEFIEAIHVQFVNDSS